MFMFQSGALLACGIVNSCVRNECDPALALLSDYVLHSNNVIRIGAINGYEYIYNSVPLIVSSNNLSLL